MQGLGFHDVCHLKLLDEPGLPNPLHIRSGIIIVTIFVIFIFNTYHLHHTCHLGHICHQLGQDFPNFSCNSYPIPNHHNFVSGHGVFYIFLSSKQNFIFCQTRLNFRTTHGSLACLLFRGATLSDSLVTNNS